nr:putative HNH homing endonuclease [Chloroidium sp. KL-2023a]
MASNERDLRRNLQKQAEQAEKVFDEKSVTPQVPDKKAKQSNIQKENPATAGGKKPHGLTGRPRPPEVRAKISKAHKGKPKNYPSHLKGKTGPAHPSYKHGQGSHRKYDPENTTAWILAVKRQTNYKCFITGRDTDLECHHLIGYAYEPTRFLPENGVAICKEIHKEFHNQYGRGGNLPEQFEEFCREKYGITEFPWRQGNHKPSFLDFKQNLVSGINKRAKEFEDLVKSRDHSIVEGTFVNNKSMFTVRCQKHDTVSEVQVQRYKNAVFGVQCCALEKQSIAADKYRAENFFKKG